jgi:uncharacterized protein DUF6448
MTARSHQPEVPCPRGIEQGQQFERTKGRKIGIYRQAPRNHPNAMKFAALLTIIAVILAFSPRTSAHCDGLDGPVVQAAQQALETGNINLVLIWVQKSDEAEIKRAFDHTLAVRSLNAEARQLADKYFFETLVRIHRASEGASYTGLKPAGRDLGPAIPLADKALRDGNVDEVLKLLNSALERGVHEHFERASLTKDFDKNDAIAGRKFVRAYVEYIHCVEGLYRQATSPVHGHYHEEQQAAHEHEE